MYNGSCNQIPSKSSLTSLEDTSPSLRNVLSISLDLAAAALASELSTHPMITDHGINLPRLHNLVCLSPLPTNYEYR